jgi:hypothetical protein
MARLPGKSHTSPNGVREGATTIEAGNSVDADSLGSVGIARQVVAKREAHDSPGEFTSEAWRRMFQKQVRLTAWLIATTLVIIGLLTLLIAWKILHGELHQVLLEVGVSLVLFGVTTLFLTITVSNALDRSLRQSIEQTLKIHATDVLAMTTETHEAVKETAERIKPLGGNWRDLGLTNVYLTRSDALEADFGSHIREELHRASVSDPDEFTAEDEQRETFKFTQETEGTRLSWDPEEDDPRWNRCRLWIAASSMKGLLESSSLNFDGLGIFTWAAELARDGKLDLRVIMTHPEYATVRANQENRGEKAIPEEIDEALGHLKQRRVPPIRVRMVATTPTVFAIATRDQMLLNPYPYSQEAYRSFTLTVRRSHPGELGDHRAINRDIFEQYARRHFILPWISKNTQILPDDYTRPSLPEGQPVPPQSGSREDFTSTR